MATGQICHVSEAKRQRQWNVVCVVRWNPSLTLGFEKSSTVILDRNVDRFFPIVSGGR